MAKNMEEVYWTSLRGALWTGWCFFVNRMARTFDNTKCEHQELSQIQQWGIATKLQDIPEIYRKEIDACSSATISMDVCPVYSSTLECNHSISTLRSRIRAIHRNKIGTPT